MLNGLSWQKRGLVDFLNAMLVPRIQQLSCIGEVGFFIFCRKFLFCDVENMKTYLKPVQGAVVLHEEVFLFTDRKVVTKLTEKVSQVYRLHCYKGAVFNMTRSSSIASKLT